MAESATWFLGALILSVLGYVIKVKKRYDFIAGYDPSHTPNPELLGDFIGGMLFKAGGLFLGLAILRSLLSDYRWPLRVGLFGGLAWICIGLLTGARRIVQK